MPAKGNPDIRPEMILMLFMLPFQIMFVYSTCMHECMHYTEDPPLPQSSSRAVRRVPGDRDTVSRRSGSGHAGGGLCHSSEPQFTGGNSRKITRQTLNDSGFFVTWQFLLSWHLLRIMHNKHNGTIRSSSFFFPQPNFNRCGQHALHTSYATDSCISMT